MVLRARSRFKQDASASLLTPLSHHRRSPGCAPSAPVSVLLAVPGLSCFTPRPSRSAFAGGAHEAARVHRGTCRRGGGVALFGTRAAATAPAHWPAWRAQSIF